MTRRHRPPASDILYAACVRSESETIQAIDENESQRQSGRTPVRRIVRIVIRNRQFGDMKPTLLRQIGNLRICPTRKGVSAMFASVNWDSAGKRLDALS
jgi:hypothetical protein